MDEWLIKTEKEVYHKGIHPMRDVQPYKIRFKVFWKFATHCLIQIHSQVFN